MILYKLLYKETKRLCRCKGEKNYGKQTRFYFKGCRKVRFYKG